MSRLYSGQKEGIIHNSHMESGQLNVARFHPVVISASQLLNTIEKDMPNMDINVIQDLLSILRHASHQCQERISQLAKDI